MALKNPYSIAFKKALIHAHRRGEIRWTQKSPRRSPWSGRPISPGAPVSGYGFKTLIKAIFGPLTDADGRRQIIIDAMKSWRDGLKIHFPPSVWAAYSDATGHLHSKSFWDDVADAAIAVASHPAFSAVVGAATAAIPGVGAALAPIAVALQRKVTAMVKDAREGSLTAQGVLSAATEVAAAGVSAASPQAAELVEKSRAVVALANVAASSEARRAARSLGAARRTIVRAQQGDAHAAASIAVTAEKAKAGHKPSMRKLALYVSVGEGMRRGQVPRATVAEKKIYGKAALKRMAGAPPAVQKVGRAAASRSAPAAKLPAPQAVDSHDPDDPEEEEEEREYEFEGEGDGDDESGAILHSRKLGRARGPKRKLSLVRSSPAAKNIAAQVLVSNPAAAKLIASKKLTSRALAATVTKALNGKPMAASEYGPAQPRPQIDQVYATPGARLSPGEPGEDEEREDMLEDANAAPEASDMSDMPDEVETPTDMSDMADDVVESVEDNEALFPAA